MRRSQSGVTRGRYPPRPARPRPCPATRAALLKRRRQLRGGDAQMVAPRGPSSSPSVRQAPQRPPSPLLTPPQPRPPTTPQVVELELSLTQLVREVQAKDQVHDAQHAAGHLRMAGQVSEAGAGGGSERHACLPSEQLAAAATDALDEMAAMGGASRCCGRLCGAHLLSCGTCRSQRASAPRRERNCALLHLRWRACGQLGGGHHGRCGGSCP